MKNKDLGIKEYLLFSVKVSDFISKYTELPADEFDKILRQAEKKWNLMTPTKPGMQKTKGDGKLKILKFEEL